MVSHADRRSALPSSSTQGRPHNFGSLHVARSADTPKTRHASEWCASSMATATAFARDTDRAAQRPDDDDTSVEDDFGTAVGSGSLSRASGSAPVDSLPRPADGRGARRVRGPAIGSAPAKTRDEGGVGDSVTVEDAESESAWSLRPSAVAGQGAARRPRRGICGSCLCALLSPVLACSRRACGPDAKWRQPRTVPER